MKYSVEMAGGGMMYIPSFMTISSSIRVILRLFSSAISESAMLVLLMRGIYEVLR
jgi:hypothetical protein